MHSVQWVWGKATEAGEFSRIFVLAVTLPSIRLLLTVSYRKNGGAGCASCSSNNLVGEQLLPLLPRFPRLCCQCSPQRIRHQQREGREERGRTSSSKSWIKTLWLRCRSVPVQIHTRVTIMIYELSNGMIGTCMTNKYKYWSCNRLNRASRPNAAVTVRQV